MTPPRAHPPFSQYRLYGPIFHKKEGRYYYNLVPYDSNIKRTTISVARYLMSVKLGRLLDKNLETVDHIDNNKLNDNIDNLQILTRKANKDKYHDFKGRSIKKYICPVCHIQFDREIKQVLYRNRKYPPTCSRSCGGKIAHIGL
jgi:hypothetical protein